MPAEWRTHHGQPYVHVDYRGLDPEGLLATLAESRRLVEEADHDGVLLFSDMRDNVASGSYLAAVKRVNVEVFGPRRTKIVLIGIDGLKAVMLRGFNAVGRGARAVPYPDAERAFEALFSGTPRPPR